MRINRLSIAAMQNLISGKVKENQTCVLKFYSNGCHLCKSLSPYYHQLAEAPEYGGLHFFAFNIDDFPEIEEMLKFKGVPTICVVHTHVGNRKPTVRIMPDPEKPSEKTWYKVKDIKRFIKKEAL